MEINKKTQDKTKRPITFRLSGTEFKNVSNLADELGLSRSQILRESVCSFIKSNQ